MLSPTDPSLNRNGSMAITYGTPQSLWSRWPSWTAGAALLWSAIYALLGLYWTAGGGGFPFGANDVRALENGDLLAAATAPVAGPIIAGLGLVGATVAWAMLKRWRRPRTVLLVYGWSMGGLLAVVVPEVRALKHMLPMGLFGLGRTDWPTWNFIILMIGGFMWVGSTLAYQRASGGACDHCGRNESGKPSRTAVWFRRWGRVVTYVAIGAPWVYATIRMAWVLDIPLGVEPEFLAHINAANPGNGTKIMEMVLAGMCVGGSILTLGLIQRWGEVWPRWMIGLAGRRVPPLFPIIFATLVAFDLTAVGLSWSRSVPGILANGMEGYIDGYRVGLVFYLPGPAFTVWGIALGLATMAYYHRTRGRCTRCGRPVCQSLL